MSGETAKNRWQLLLAFGVVYLVWGSTYLGIRYAVATIPPSFNMPSRGPFDPVYMTALFQVGEGLGKSATPFANEPPAYPGRTSPSRYARSFPVVKTLLC